MKPMKMILIPLKMSTDKNTFCCIHFPISKMFFFSISKQDAVKSRAVVLYASNGRRGALKNRF